MRKIVTPKSAIWYHGGPRIRPGSVISWDRDRSTSDLNAEGPGMYFTTSLDEAASYVGDHGEVVRAQMRSGFRLLPKKRPSLATFRAFYDLAPDESKATFLGNWSIEYPATPHEVASALRHYTHQTTLHDALVTLYHDLYQYDADAYVSAVHELGFDGVVIAKGTTGGSARRDHLIVWNPSALTFI